MLEDDFRAGPVSPPWAVFGRSELGYKQGGGKSR